MSKYRRIEINAYHRRVTVVSGEWRPDDLCEAQPSESEDGVSLNDSDSCEPVAPDSPEGQLLLVEAMRSLEQRLTPEGRAFLCADEDTPARPTNFSLSPDPISDPRARRQTEVCRTWFAERLKPRFFLSQAAILLSICLPRSSALCSKGKVKCVNQTKYKTAPYIRLV